MEDLKMLIGMVKDLPALAIWVLVLYFLYKVFIVGSIYGVIRLAINRMHSWKTKPPPPPQPLQPQEWDIDGMIITHDGTKKILMRALSRCLGTGSYIHTSNAVRLNEAIDLWEAKHEKSIGD